MGKMYPTLKVDNFKEVRINVQFTNKNNIGLSKEEVIVATKLRFLQNGLKVTDEISRLENLWIKISMLDIIVGERDVGCALYLDLSFQIFADDLKSFVADPFAGQASQMIITSKKDFFNAYNIYLDRFILDYLESNME
jgi:hypothetical protein